MSDKRLRTNVREKISSLLPLEKTLYFSSYKVVRVASHLKEKQACVQSTIFKIMVLCLDYHRWEKKKKKRISQMVSLKATWGLLSPEYRCGFFLEIIWWGGFDERCWVLDGEVKILDHPERWLATIQMESFRPQNEIQIPWPSTQGLGSLGAPSWEGLYPTPQHTSHSSAMLMAPSCQWAFGLCTCSACLACNPPPYLPDKHKNLAWVPIIFS